MDIDIVFQKPSGLISGGFCFAGFFKLPLEICWKSAMIVYD
jgi:hypothetical protein